MLDTLIVKVSKKEKKGVTGYEGSVTIPGISNARLSKKDGNTFFPSRSSLNTVAKNLGKRLDLVVKFVEPKKAATAVTV